MFKKCGRLRPVGVDEARLWNILDRIFPGDVWSVQDRLRGWAGKVDACMYFPWETWLAIQVDGITHGRQCMRDKPNQLQVDARFNSVAMAAGMSVVRLDTRHSDSAWEDALRRARDACRYETAPVQLFCSR